LVLIDSPRFVLSVLTFPLFFCALLIAGWSPPAICGWLTLSQRIRLPVSLFDGDGPLFLSLSPLVSDPGPALFGDSLEPAFVALDFYFGEKTFSSLGRFRNWPGYHHRSMRDVSREVPFGFWLVPR